MAAKEKPVKPARPPKEPAKAHAGERIAKVLSRAGVASRREAERMIELGEVAVNGKIITSPALNVTASDRITVNGQPLAAAEPARLWLYYKPEGLVTSQSDEKGRETVFDNLPPELPRVMSVGRLDLNSEGLLLLTNDGGLKRRLELPSTGWLRKYRVRVNGNPMDTDLEPLRRGITVDGEKFQAMMVVLDRIQGANAWLTVGIREGKNREIRRAMSAINLTVNRLIRVSYGPFRLGDLEPGQVEEIKGRVLRDQLGETDPDDGEVAAKRPRAPTRISTTSSTGGRKPTLKPGAGLKAISDADVTAITPKSGARRALRPSDLPRRAAPDAEPKSSRPARSPAGSAKPGDRSDPPTPRPLPAARPKRKAPTRGTAGTKPAPKGGPKAGPRGGPRGGPTGDKDD